MKKSILISIISLSLGSCSSYNSTIGFGFKPEKSIETLSVKKSIAILELATPILSAEESLFIKKLHHNALAQNNYNSNIHTSLPVKSGNLVTTPDIIEELEFGKELSASIEQNTKFNPSEYVIRNPSVEQFGLFFSDKNFQNDLEFENYVKNYFDVLIKRFAETQGFNVSQVGEEYRLSLSKNGYGILGLELVDELFLTINIAEAGPSPVYWNDKNPFLGYQPKWEAGLSLKIETLERVDLLTLDSGKALLSKVFASNNSFVFFSQANQVLTAYFNSQMFEYHIGSLNNVKVVSLEHNI